MNKKALYVELPCKVINDSKKLAQRLDIPMTKLVELSLKELLVNNTQLSLSLNVSKRK